MKAFHEYCSKLTKRKTHSPTLWQPWGSCGPRRDREDREERDRRRDRSRSKRWTFRQKRLQGEVYHTSTGDHWASLRYFPMFGILDTFIHIYTMIWDHLRYFKIKKPFWDHRSTGMLPFNVFVCFPCYVINEELGKANNKPVQIGVYYRIYIYIIYRIPLLGMRQLVNMTSTWFLN